MKEANGIPAMYKEKVENTLRWKHAATSLEKGVSNCSMIESNNYIKRKLSN